MEDMRKRAELIVHLSKVQENFRSLIELCPKNKLIPMIKANAYGHGDGEIYEVLSDENLIEGFGLMGLNILLHPLMFLENS